MSLMSAYNAVGWNSSLRRTKMLLQDVLRGEWGFHEGAVLSATWIMLSDMWRSGHA